MDLLHAAQIPSRQKVFITIGHQTTMARTLFFGVPEGSQHACTQAQLGQAMFAHVGKFASEALTFDLSQEYVFQPELYGIAGVSFIAEWCTCIAQMAVFVCCLLQQEFSIMPTCVGWHATSAVPKNCLFPSVTLLYEVASNRTSRQGGEVCQYKFEGWGQQDQFLPLGSAAVFI